MWSCLFVCTGGLPLQPMSINCFSITPSRRVMKQTHFLRQHSMIILLKYFSVIIWRWMQRKRTILTSSDDLDDDWHEICNVCKVGGRFLLSGSLEPSYKWLRLPKGISFLVPNGRLEKTCTNLECDLFVHIAIFIQDWWFFEGPSLHLFAFL